MRSFNLVTTVSTLLLLSAGCSSSSGTHDASTVDGSTGTDAGPTPDVAVGVDSQPDVSPTTDAAATDAASSDASAADASAADAAPLSTQAMRGKYLVGVLGCANCHTPKVTGTMMADPTMTLAGVDCFVSMPGCLSSGNLTPDVDTGLGGFTDQAIIDAFRTGKEPDPQAAGKFLFARMPYYQFANVSDDDAKAIVAYLRAIPAVKHEVKEATAPFDQSPTTPEWTPVDPAKLPSPGAGAPADAANGKYLASLLCVNCHSGDAAGTPKHIDETMAFQGGQSATITVAGAMMMFQSANLTPDMTGLKAWTAAQIVTAIKTAKDPMGKTLCAPMRGNAVITDADATAIADYLMSIPPVAHTVAACMARM